MSSSEGNVLRIAKAVLLVLGSLAGAVFLAAVAQTPFLTFFYWIVPGEKSTDGPILVVLAYLLLLLVVPAILALGRRRLGKTKAIGVAVASGPTLMLIASAACAWAARLP